MKRAYAKRHDSHKPEPAQPAVPIEATGREIQLSLDRDELLGLMQDSLESLALKLGMLVASSLLEDEVTRLCGPRHERQPHRTHTRYGHQRGTATLAGQKIAIARPRVRRTDGGGEVPLETYARLQSPEAMPEAVLRRMVRGVSTRDYGDVIDLTRDGFGVQKSSVSRDFVRASAAQVKALAERRFDGMHFRRKFRRVKGRRALPALIKALEQSTRARRSGIEPRRRVRMAWGTTSPHANGWDRVAPGDGAPDLSSFPGSRPCPTHPTRTPRGPISPPRPASISPLAPHSPAVTASSRRWSGPGRTRSTAPTT